MEGPDKATLRARLLAARRARTAGEVARRSDLLAARVLELPEFRAAGTVALYQALPHEPDPAAIALGLGRRGLRTVFPRIVRGTRLLAFGAAASAGDLVPGPMGIREPPPDADVPLAAIELFVVPGVGFDRGGWRLGHGGGYYDVTLAAVRPDVLRIGLCFDEELLERLPAEAHDAPVDVVVTDLRTIRPPRRPGNA